MPDLLTVEEAAAVLRIGRTKAYTLARQWRASGGRFGLPVVDLGHVLRVPRAALEKLVGNELTSRPPRASTTPTHTAPSSVVDLNRRATSRPETRSRSRRTRRPDRQLSLFDTPTGTP